MAGFKAKKSGEFFETMIEFRAKQQGICVIRIPDGCVKRLVKGRFTLLPVKSPFDYILAQGGKVAFIDAKMRTSDRLAHSDLSIHQVHSLYLLGRHQMAGYVCYFKPVDRVVFFDSKQLFNLKRGQSLKFSDGMNLGTLKDFHLSVIFSITGE
jgi:hypothetical protein